MADKNLDELFGRYLTGIATPEEIRALMEWLDSPDNEAQALRLMQEGWEKFASSGDVVSPETSARMLNGILTAVPATEENRPGRLLRIVQFFTAGRVAAAVLLLSLGGIYLATRPSSAGRSVAVVPAPARPVIKDIPPGSDGAILTLADGRNIVVDSAGNGELARQGNTRIVKQKGRLSYTVMAKTNEKPLYNTMHIPRGRQFQLVLPDGSHVWLNAASSIRYPTAFTGKERKVEITGEAYFEVAQDVSRPFRVRAGETEVDVLGTHFNIMAYEEENAVSTTLLEGAVKVIHAGSSHLLRPGQEARMSKDTRDIQVIDDAPVSEAVAWKNELFSFHNGASLQDVMRQIARWYDVTIVYEGDPHSMEFGGKISRNSNLSEVLKILEISKVHFRIEEKKIIVMP
jgi:transmembrane sensor